MNGDLYLTTPGEMRELAQLTERIIPAFSNMPGHIVSVEPIFKTKNPGGYARFIKVREAQP